MIQFKVVLFHVRKHDPKRPKYKTLFSMGYWERGSHARGVYPRQYTSRMGTDKGEARGRNRHIRIMKDISKKSGRKERGHEGEKLQTRPN